MIVCPDCRKALPCSCGWTPVDRGPIRDFLSSADRRSEATASYMETYDLLATHNLASPSISNRYVENLARHFIAHLELEGKDFCDVGSGRGYLIKCALERNPKSVSAVDIAASSLADVAKRYPIQAFLANAEKLPFDRHFDVLTATDIVEHVLNVANFMVTANWSLRDGGTLALRVPYRENMLWYSNFYGLPMHYTHLRTFDRRLLIDLVEPAGFEVQSISYDGFLSARTRPWLNAIPGAKRAVVYALESFFGGDDVTNIQPLLGRLLMRPVEISLVARKVRHLQVHDEHPKLGEFARSYRVNVESSKLA